MASWTFEPGHTEAGFRARHMMVTWVPTITFPGRLTERVGDMAFRAVTELTIRGQTREVPLDVVYLGKWLTPFWVGDENRGDMRRIGFEARTHIDRHDLGVSWNDELSGGGLVASNRIEVVLDVEAIADEDLEKTGAIAYYRDQD